MVIHPTGTCTSLHNKYIQSIVPTHTLSMILMISALRALVPLVPISDSPIVLMSGTASEPFVPANSQGYGIRVVMG